MVDFPSVLLTLCGNTKNEVKVPGLAATSQVKDLTGCQTFIEHTVGFLESRFLFLNSYILHLNAVSHCIT